MPMFQCIPERWSLFLFQGGNEAFWTFYSLFLSYKSLRYKYIIIWLVPHSLDWRNCARDAEDDYGSY